MDYDKIKELFNSGINPVSIAELGILIKLKRINISLSKLKRILNALHVEGVITFDVIRVGEKRIPTRFYSLIKNN